MGRPRKDTLAFNWAGKGRWNVVFTNNLFDEDNETMARTLRETTLADRPRTLVVADSNVVQHTPGLGSGMGRYFMAHDIELAASPVVSGGGEKLKLDGLSAVTRIVEAAVAANLGRNDAILAIGGGALLDVASFAAACIRGGVKTVRVPTTPAAMIDGAYSQYAAFDTPGEKDAVRVESRPSAVVVDAQFSTTVLDGVWRGGLGEIVRACVSAGEDMVSKFMDAADYLRCHDTDALAAIARQCVEARIKNGPCRAGEWCAAKLETMSGYRLPHGYAVPMGFCIDCGYAVRRGYMEPGQRDAVKAMFADCGALDGLSHSHHLLSQPDIVVAGIDTWMRAEGTDGLELPAGFGRRVVEAEPDKALYEETLKDFLSESIGA